MCNSNIFLYSDYPISEHCLYCPLIKQSSKENPNCVIERHYNPKTMDCQLFYTPYPIDTKRNNYYNHIKQRKHYAHKQKEAC